MADSLNSNPRSTASTEEPPNLSQNQDEALDLHLGLGALGGLRHSAACEAAARSQRRYDDRQHRLHESRMKRLGMEGEEKPEDDMGQQVLIRSPVTNHYHYADAEPTEKPAEKSSSGLSTLAKLGIGAALLLGGAGGGALLMQAFTPAPTTASGDRDTLIEYTGRGWQPGEAPTYTDETP